jgi:hypothetical protein
MTQDVAKMRPGELARELYDLVALTPKPADTALRMLSLIKEMRRRLEEVDDCICWGVDCVHQAKELDKSYHNYALGEQAREVLEDLCAALDQWEAGKTTSLPPSGWGHIVEKGRALIAKLMPIREDNMNHEKEEDAVSAPVQRVEVVRDLLAGPSNEEKLALKKVLADYIEYRGWNHASIVFGYLIGLGFSALKANELQSELLEEFRRG